MFRELWMSIARVVGVHSRTRASHRVDSRLQGAMRLFDDGEGDAYCYSHMRHRPSQAPRPRLARYLTGSLTALLMLSACGAPARDVLTVPTAPTTTVPLGTDFTLAPGDAAVVNGSTLSITFVGVTSESRCPTNALIQCVWAGSARIALRATTSSGTRDIALETMASKDVETIEQFVVHLVAVTPGPVTTDPIPAGAYRATLRIVRKT